MTSNTLTFLTDEELHVLHVHHAFVLASTITTLTAKSFAHHRLAQIAELIEARNKVPADLP